MPSRLSVGIDLFPVVPGTGRGGGFLTYARELVAALSTEARSDFLLHVYVNPLNAGWVEPSASVVRHVVPLSPRREVWPLRLLWQHGMLPLRALKDRLDVMHFPFDTIWARGPVPCVVTIHDTISDVFYPRVFPGAIPPFKAAYLRRAKRHAARRSAAVIAPAAATARSIAEAYGIAVDGIRVVPEGVRAGTAAAAEHDPFVLTVASLSPHKNLVAAVRAVRLLCEQVGRRIPLHVIGMPGVAPEMARSALAEETLDGVVFRGWVSDDELRRAYGEAAVLLFVPLDEGFGLPPVEAMAAGTPVVASDIPVMREVCGDAALLVPPGDPAAIARALASVLDRDGTVRSRLVAAGRSRAARLTWQDAARRTLAVYRDAAGASVRTPRPEFAR